MIQKTDQLLFEEIFFDFEQNVFVNEGTWPRKVNLVFAFADYISDISDEDLAIYLKTTNPRSIQKFRASAQKSIDLWLQQNIKTLML